MSGTGSPRDSAPKAGVMGWPVGHSLSPRLHNYWLETYKLAGTYDAFAIEPDNLERSLRDLPKLGFTGVNLTVPHKEAAIAFVDSLDPVAERIGAVNTVLVGKDGKLEGRNTDAFGFAENLKQGGYRSTTGIAVIFGAGGGARAVAAALIDMGLKEIRVLNRHEARAEELARMEPSIVKSFAWKTPASAFAGADLLVNATSLGMQGQLPLEMDLAELSRDAFVTDLVYAPLMTGLLADAKARGNKIVDGLGMLLHQARPAFQAFFGRDPEVNEALREHVLEKK
jgi:shikimate dehydrogenase